MDPIKRSGVFEPGFIFLFGTALVSYVSFLFSSATFLELLRLPLSRASVIIVTVLFVSLFCVYILKAKTISRKGLLSFWALFFAVLIVALAVSGYFYDYSYDGQSYHGEAVLQLSLSRLNHWLPRCKTHPKVVQGAADFHHQITNPLLPQADAVLHDAAALDTAVDMLDPQPAVVQRLVRSVLRQREIFAAWLLGRHEDLDLGSVKARKPRSCNNRLPAGKGYGVASAIGLSWTRPP